jgi:dihydrolipoamide dehydrogenase
MIVVLGGGPAGRLAAMHLSHAGKHVLLVERDAIGGTCLNFGCMVVCALNDAARSISGARELYQLGVLDSCPVVKFPALIREMHNVQETIRKVLDSETRATGVEIMYGTDAVLEGKTVRIGDEIINPDSVIAATGSVPAIPEIPGIHKQGIYNPHTLSGMKDLPKRIVILGGGVMAAEFAYIFSSFGSEVHLIARSGLLKLLDPKQLAVARKELKEVFICEHTGVPEILGEDRVTAVMTCGTTNPREEVPCDAVFVATGLRPRSEHLHGIEKGPSGEVLVGPYMETSVKGVYAAGDVTGPPYLTPVARHEGIVAAEHILGRRRNINYRYFPQSVNLANEHAFCNPGGDECVKMGVPGPAGPGTFWKVPFGTTGLARVSIDPSDRSVAGLSASGPGAGIISSYISFLMQKGIIADDFDDFLEIHPETDGVYGLIRYASDYLKEHNQE